MMLSVEQQGRAIVRGGLAPLESVERMAQIRLRNREIPVRERAEYAAVLFRGYVENHHLHDTEPVF